MAKKPEPPAAPAPEPAIAPPPVLPQSGGAFVLVDGKLVPETPVEPPVQTPVEGAV